MAYGGLNLFMDAAAELGRNPVSKHQIEPKYGDEQADAGRDCRTRLALPNSHIHTLAICVTIHTVFIFICLFLVHLFISDYFPTRHEAYQDTFM